MRLDFSQMQATAAYGQRSDAVVQPADATLEAGQAHTTDTGSLAPASAQVTLSDAALARILAGAQRIQARSLNAPNGQVRAGYGLQNERSADASLSDAPVTPRGNGSGR